MVSSATDSKQSHSFSMSNYRYLCSVCEYYFHNYCVTELLLLSLLFVIMVVVFSFDCLLLSFNSLFDC